MYESLSSDYINILFRVFKTEQVKTLISMLAFGILFEWTQLHFLIY